MRSIREIRIFIASPSDLKTERDCIEQTVQNLNNDPLIQRENVCLKIDRWENAYPQAGRPQGIINKDVRICDLFIGMLHRRFGAHTGKAESGTYEEFAIAFDRWRGTGSPQIMFYFKTVGEMSLKDLTDKQLCKVLEFKDKIESEKILLCGKFTEKEDFSEKIEIDLKKAIIDLCDKAETGEKRSGKTVKPGNITPYLTWLEQRCNQMDLQKLAITQPIIVGLPELFIPLFADDPDRPAGMPENTGQEHHIAEQEQQFVPVDIEVLASKNDYLLIEGEPGCGKTTLFKQIALKMKRQMADDTFELPVLVFLRDCIIRFKEEDSYRFSAEEILEAYFSDHEHMLSCETVRYYCERKQVLFLIDGLDEVPDDKRDQIVKAFAEFRLKYGVRMLLSGRKHGVMGEAMQWFGNKYIKIHPFNDEQIRLFVKRWCEYVFIKRLTEGHKTAEDLCSELQLNSAVKALIVNPLMLTTVCILYYEGEKLPEQRAELYRKFVENLVKRRFDQADRILEILKGFGFAMQASGEKGIGRNDALAIVKKTFRQAKKEECQKYIRRINAIFDDFEPKCGLLRLENGHYRFWHLTFQEYLTAEYLIATSEDPVKAIEPYLKNEQYKETVRLYIGCLSLNQKTVAAKIIRNVLERQDATPDEMLLVGDALVDIKKERRDDLLIGEIQQRYWEVIGNGELSIRKKLELGEIIGWIGDERDQCEFVEIKDGTYDLENIGKRSIGPFAISKYPVTNRWLAEFVNLGGYEKKEYWSDEGWQFREKEKILKPLFWGERKYNCPNLPVVGVSWYEAYAFVTWLNSTSFRGCTSYRLPSEEEWQASAAGFEKRAFPWGNDFNADLCNCYEGEDKINKTSVVGIFPAGNTPEGVSDLAGNVWEWTITREGSFRVLRGGSWGSNARYCPCAYRYVDDPGYRCGNIGFRVVSSRN